MHISGNIIPSQIVATADYVKNLPGRKGTTTRELVFLASKLPPLGSHSYYVQPATTIKTDKKIKNTNARSFSISNEVSCLFIVEIHVLLTNALKYFLFRK